MKYKKLSELNSIILFLVIGLFSLIFVLFLCILLFNDFSLVILSFIFYFFINCFFCAFVIDENDFYSIFCFINGVYEYNEENEKCKEIVRFVGPSEYKSIFIPISFMFSVVFYFWFVIPIIICKTLYLYFGLIIDIFKILILLFNLSPFRFIVIVLLSIISFFLFKIAY
jgi:hypothetical protein